NIDLVNIYSIGQGVIAYSTDPELIGKKVTESLGYKKAVKGENSSRLISSGNDIWGTGIETIGSDKKLRTFFPFKWLDPQTKEPYVGGVFELIQDLTKEYQSVVKLQYLIFIVSSLVTVLIFVALLLIVRKAERMIEERAGDQRELEAQLNQAERLAALGKMVAGVSHEIRNPLGIIRSTAELLEGMPDCSETQAKLSNVIIQESSRLNDVVTEFLDFARPQKPHLQDCYLDEIIKKNLDFLQLELEKENITLYHNLGNRSLNLSADPQLIYRSFLNIFANALQSMKGGGALTVNVDGEKDHYIVRVEDTGIGVSEENLSKIFDPFFSTKDKGSGLGLSIVRNIIEGHNGAIWIESKEGSGTSIFIKLPRGC
ncbi:MAG: GHKL domain-containing protein, partial [Desulfobacterales bacterium]|nr:GHKL domain-containing protein [Desulfobacterales bacterium]